MTNVLLLSRSSVIASSVHLLTVLAVGTSAGHSPQPGLGSVGWFRDHWDRESGQLRCGNKGSRCDSSGRGESVASDLNHVPYVLIVCILLECLGGSLWHSIEGEGRVGDNSPWILSRCRSRGDGLQTSLVDNNLWILRDLLDRSSHWTAGFSLELELLLSIVEQNLRLDWLLWQQAGVVSRDRSWSSGSSGV